MKNLPKEEIINIATNIMNSGDIIAKHGTTIENAISIINTGFNYTRTSYVIQSSKNIESLCKYGWKENKPNDATNVVIEIPREFIMDLLSMTSIEEYNKWLEYITKENTQDAVIKSVTTIVTTPASEKVGNFFYPPTLDAHIPQEFIAGAFVWCNGKTYLNLKEGESALDNLNFIPNEKFYTNLKPEEKKEIVTRIQQKIGIKSKQQTLQ